MKYVLMNHSARVRLTPRLAVGFDAGLAPVCDRSPRG
jgi:hypothetical protein